MHRIFRKWIPLWLSGQLTAAEEREFEIHRQECAECSSLAAADERVWKQLNAMTAESSRTPASVWPAVRRRTLAGRSGAAWLFGSSRWIGATLAAGALAMGLLTGLLAPGAPVQASVVEDDANPWEGGSSWLTDSTTDGLAGLWLAPGLASESDGS